MKLYQSPSKGGIIIFAIFIQTIIGVASAKDDAPNPAPVPSLSVPNLPTGPITGNTVDCVNSKFYKIRDENQHLAPWLTDVQRTVERLFAVRKRCDDETKVERRRQRDCISAWNRAAGVQFLRLGLSLFEQDNPKGNQLEILNVFVTEFQGCW